MHVKRAASKKKGFLGVRYLRVDFGRFDSGNYSKN